MYNKAIANIFSILKTRWFSAALSIGIASVDQWMLYQSIIEKNSWTSDVPFLMTFQFSVLAIGVYLSLRTITRETSKNRSLMLFLSMVFLFAYWIPLGFDLTDEGRRMSFSYFFMDNYLYHLVNFKLGSHFLTYLWLHIINVPSVLWMRIGFLLCKTAYMLVVFKILTLYFNSRHAAFGTLAGAIVSVVFADQVLDYNNIPALLVLLAILSIELAFKNGITHRKHQLVLAGILTTAAVLSKFPIISTLPILLVYILLKHQGKKAYGTILSSLGWFLMGFTSFYIGFVVLLWMNDLALVYFEKIHTVFIEPFLFGDQTEAVHKLARHGHDPSSIGSKYLKHTTLVWNQLWIYLLSFLPILILKKNWSKPLVFLTWMVPVVLIILQFNWEDWVFEFIAIVLGLFFLATLFYIKRLKEYPILALSFPLIIGLFVGTNNGLINLYITGGLTLTVSVSVAAISCYNKQHAIGIIGIALIISVVAWDLKSETIYRNLDQSYLTSTFKSPSLRGIYATHNRVMLMDSTLNAFVKHIEHDSSATLLSVNTVPAFNYLLNVKHTSLLFWRLSGMTEHEKIEFLKSNSAPKYLVVGKLDARLRYWPNFNALPYSPNDSAAYSFYASYLNSNSSTYDELYSNQGFELWVKSK